jgi:hypothetical protein
MAKAILLFALDQLEVIYNDPHKQLEKCQLLPPASIQMLCGYR